MDTPMPVSMVDTGPMVPTPLPTDMDTEPMEPTPILTMARGPLMLSPRLRLMLRPIPLSSMALMDTPMLVSMVDTEPMVPTPLLTDMDTEPMEPTPTLTMERGLLMLSPRLRPRLTPPSSTPPPMLSLPRSLTPASPRSTLAFPRSLTPAPTMLSSPRLSTMLPSPRSPPTTPSP